MKTIDVNCSQCNVILTRPYSVIASNLKKGFTNNFCSIKCCSIFNRFVNKKLRSLRELEYYKNPKLCIFCKKIIIYDKFKKQIYCSSRCSATHTQISGGHKILDDKQKLDLSKKVSISLLNFYSRNPPKKITKICPTCKIEFYVSLSRSNARTCSKKCHFEWIRSTGYMKGKTGGFRENSGTSKKGWYKGIFCGSSWELAWVIFNIDHNIKFHRNKEGFKYTFCGKSLKYYPDFILDDKNVYIEIKNYHTDKLEAKSKQFPHELNILYKKDLKYVFEYVEKVYGKNYIGLYDNKSSGRSPM